MAEDTKGISTKTSWMGRVPSPGQKDTYIMEYGNKDSLSSRGK
jgi:hypothetical protein